LGPFDPHLRVENMHIYACGGSTSQSMPSVRKVCFRRVVYYKECYARSANASPVSKIRNRSMRVRLPCLWNGKLWAILV